MALTSLTEQFLNPDDEFTPVPFWFWNDALTAEELVRQIRDFADKGVMGFVLHPRIGIPEELPYMSDVFLGLVETAVSEAASLGMRVMLYDEAMYPSGSAKGGVVAGNPEYASRGLRMVQLDGGQPVSLAEQLAEGDELVAAGAWRTDPDVVGSPANERYVPLRPQDGTIRWLQPGEGDWSIVLFIETFSNGTIRGIHFGEDDGEPNAPASADLLNRDATEKFIRLTHDKYFAKVGSYFGSTITAMFTDEPDILGRRHRKGLKPWTSGFMDDFLRTGHSEAELPLLWLDAPGSEAVRLSYRRAVNERLANSYYKPLADWCERHGIALTGHPAASDDIGLLAHFQIPGQDVVWRWVDPDGPTALEGAHSTAAKCSSDAARHRGRRRNLNEVLGVCSPGGGWALSGSDVKWYIDWLTVRGVNLLSPHAFYYSIAGPRRLNERPPDVGPNNIWWPHYRQFSQYMKRMSWVMTDSANVTPIAVLCRQDRLPWKLAKQLYTTQREFNYLEESLLTSACDIEDGQIRIAAQSYSVVLVEEEHMADAQTIRTLERFISQGGTVICLRQAGQSGKLPGADAVSEPEQLPVALQGRVNRDVSLEPACPDIRVSHVVKNGTHLYVLVNEGGANYDGVVTLRTAGQTERWDAWEGSVSEASFVRSPGGMSGRITIQHRQSAIIRVEQGEAAEVTQPTEAGEHNVKKSAAEEKVVLDDGWYASIAGGEPVTVRLGSWTEWSGMAHYSGTVTYKYTFILHDIDRLKAAVLDLGDAGELAEVWVNGLPAGVRMWKPYTYEILPLLRERENELRIEVTNSLANRYDSVSLPSGLLGPAALLLTRS